jgi:hypothetical protein
VKKRVFGFVALAVVMILSLVYFPIRQSVALRGLEREVAGIAWPLGIEKVALHSAVGDSGGNGDHSTLRAVLVVKSVLDTAELSKTIESLELRFPNHYKYSNGAPLFFVTPCTGSTFKSEREFTLHFEELNQITEFNNLYFLEFVE